MAGHTVRLLATCSAFAFALSSSAGALEINTPRVNVPAPHINVPKPHINVPTVKLQLSNHANAVTSVKTPSVGSSNAQAPIGIKVITNTAGGSATPTQVQQQNAVAAVPAQQQPQEAAVATGIAGAAAQTAAQIAAQAAAQTAAEAAAQGAMAAGASGITHIPGGPGLGMPELAATEPLMTKVPPPGCYDCTLQQSANNAYASLNATCSLANSAVSAAGNGDAVAAIADIGKAIQTAENASFAAGDASSYAGRSDTPAAWEQAAAAALAAAEAWANAAAAMIAAGQPLNSPAIANAYKQAEEMAVLAAKDAAIAKDAQTTAYAVQTAQVGQAINTWQTTGILSSATACVYNWEG